MPFLLVLILALMLSGAPTAVAEPVPEPLPQPILTHAQEVWLGALEWCESRGNPLAINKKDRDGTPSYGSFQFKPSTLWYYAKKYGVATKDSDYMLYGRQLAVVTQMVAHRDEINWHQQFPDCVKRLGLPPASVSKPQS